MNSLETTIVFIILVLIDLCPSVIVYLAAVLTLPSPAVSGSVRQCLQCQCLIEVRGNFIGSLQRVPGPV